MGRTWWVRGTVVTVIAVLAAAWGVGVSGLTDDSSRSGDRPPASPDTSIAPIDERSAAPEKAQPHARKTGRSQDSVPEPSETDDEPVTDAPSTPASTEPVSTPEPTRTPEGPSDSPPPTTPNDTPSQPPDECTDLLSCVLDPITGSP